MSIQVTESLSALDDGITQAGSNMVAALDQARSGEPTDFLAAQVAVAKFQEQIGLKSSIIAALHRMAENILEKM